MEEKISGVRGFFRVNITEDDNGVEKIVGDSGWVQNMITNDGISKFLACFAGSADSLQAAYVTLGSGSAPASNSTSLPDEVLEASKRVAPTYAFSQRAASNGTCTYQWTATFASSDGFLGGTYNISNLGILNSITSGTLMAGNTYTSSSCATNQNVNVTYQIRMSFS